MAENIKTWNGGAWSTVKTWLGGAESTVKSWNGVDNTAAAGGTPTWVQDDGASFDPFNASRSVTFSSSTTSGNAIIVVYQGSNTSSLSVTDSKSNSYSVVVDGSTSGIAIAVASNITGGSSHQVTCTVTSHSNPGGIIILEYSGIAASSPFDVGGQGYGFVANSSVTTAATSQDVELLFGVLWSGSGSVTAGSGFTLRHTQGTTYTESKNSAAAGAQTINFTHSERAAGISVATFKAS